VKFFHIGTYNTMKNLVKSFSVMVLLNKLLLSKSLRWRFVENKDALWNDFTQAGYYLRNSTSSQNWVVFLEGGGACYSPETCSTRCTTDHESHLRYFGGETVKVYKILFHLSQHLSLAWQMVKNTEIEETDILSTDCDIY